MSVEKKWNEFSVKHITLNYHLMKHIARFIRYCSSSLFASSSSITFITFITSFSSSSIHLSVYFVSAIIIKKGFLYSKVLKTWKFILLEVAQDRGDKSYVVCVCVRVCVFVGTFNDEKCSIHGWCRQLYVESRSHPIGKYYSTLIICSTSLCVLETRWCWLGLSSLFLLQHNLHCY